ncbi:hypothetical protein [Curtobacterium poinsettiae]|uniref:hypothetical protein n=1 Tax=Curtobacterium poinsettiae TaxID=159612 RepID=UPI001BDE54DE|nr:hypothetical protein [Curtobacterium flaccumfaciens]MBT1611866.1 hypothetical protein [Curtobacterium flaccumfaciens pv. poinsettiae]
MSVQVTDRDAAMFEWFRIVRLTTMEGIRWALGALNHSTGPVSRNQAFVWVRRMEEAGMVERSRVPPFKGTMVWATPKAVGKRRPDLLRQTTRHELMVSVASARYLNAGWGWDRDLPEGMLPGRPRAADQDRQHSADGIAFNDGVSDLVEVELTAKRKERYPVIFEGLRDRLATDDSFRVVYLCTADAGRAVRQALKRGPGEDIAERTLVVDLFGRDGSWIGDEYPAGLFDAKSPLVNAAVTLDGIGAWVR